MGQFGMQGIALAIVALVAVLLVSLAGARLGWRAWVRRRREAQRQAGLQFAFDACAPEGADLSLEPLRLRYLLGDGANDPGRRR